MNASELSRLLRHGSGRFLIHRRGIIGLALTAASSMGLITLYQTGLIRHLPEPPLARLDSDKITASKEAYALVSTPDAALGLLSYATTMTLAAMGGPDRARARPALPLLLLAKVGLDTWQAGRRTVHQWTRHRALCSYCLVAAGATLAMVPLVLPEASCALQTLRAALKGR
jgi:hypothetical protein